MIAMNILTPIVIRQKIFNQKKYCNVGMTQQRSLAKKDKKSDVGMVTG